MKKYCFLILFVFETYFINAQILNIEKFRLDYDTSNYFSNRKYTLQYDYSVGQTRIIDGKRVDIKIEYPNKRNQFYKLTQKEGFLLWKSEK